MMGVQSSKLPAFSPRLEQKEGQPAAFCPIFEPRRTESGNQIMRQASQQLLLYSVSFCSYLVVCKFHYFDTSETT
jgi:hypothetical protein